MIMTLNVRALAYFRAVAETGSFSRAAELCGVVQSAISHQVRAIELDYGIDLLRRESKGAVLTAAGLLLLDHARSIARLIERADADLRGAASGDLGQLRIGFQSAASRQPVVSSALQRLRENCPGIGLDLTPATGLNMQSALRDQRLDGAFMYLDEDAGLVREVLQTDNWVLAIPASHRLAAKSDLRLADLAGEPFIFLPRAVNPGLNDRILAACASGGLVPNIVQEAYDEPMVASLVAVGLGIAFVLDNIPTGPRDNVVLRRVEDFSVPVDLCFVWNRGNANAALARFRSLLEA